MFAHNWNRIFVYIWTNCFHERWISNETGCKLLLYELYELGPARRHKCENGTRIYIVYFGWSAPKVKKEIVYQKNEETQKQIVDVDTQKIIPGLYYVSWDTKSSVYRIETKKKILFCNTLLLR